MALRTGHLLFLLPFFVKACRQDMPCRITPFIQNGKGEIAIDSLDNLDVLLGLRQKIAKPLKIRIHMREHAPSSPVKHQA